MLNKSKNILIIFDSGFKNLCKDPEDYLTRLKALLRTMSSNSVFHTVSGKHGYQGDNELNVLEIEDKNKTMFVQTIENLSDQTDELVIVSIVESDPFIDALMNNLDERHVCIRRYKYEVKP